MLTIPVALPMFITSQIIGFIAFFVVISGYSTKKRIKTFWCFGAANLLIAISVAMLGNWVFATLSTISFVRNFVFYFIERRKAKCKITPRWIYVLIASIFILVTIIPTIFIWQWWVDWAIVATKIFIIIMSLTQSIGIFRASYISSDLFTVLNHIKFFNIIGLVQTIFFIVANTVFLIRYARRKSDEEFQTDQICPIN